MTVAMPPPTYVNHFPNPKTNVTGNSATPRRTASTIGTVGGIITTTTSNAMASSAPAPPAENKHPSSGILPQTPQRYVESLTNKVVLVVTHPSIVLLLLFRSACPATPWVQPRACCAAPRPLLSTRSPSRARIRTVRICLHPAPLRQHPGNCYIFFKS